MIKVGIFGSTGKMGALLIDNLNSYDGLSLSTVFFKNRRPKLGNKNVILTNDITLFLNSCDLVIDFSVADATQMLLENALKKPIPLVIGTTGLSSTQFDLLKKLSSSIPILYSSNMSLGVAFLNKAVLDFSKNLKDFDIEIVETHHKDKKDSPSGTALSLAKSASLGRGLKLEDVIITGRCGNIGGRTKDEIAVMSLRAGDIVGKHNVGFYGDGEYLELSHTATSRATFVRGALYAALWLKGKKEGLYDIYDCLGI